MNDFYGDNISRFWFGLVRNHSDPLKLGRVKVRIAGIHGNFVRDADLPWAQIVLPTTEPGINGLGSPPLLKTGAQVFGIFLDGKESQLPLVLGSVPRLAMPPERQLQTSGGDTQTNVTAVARGNAEAIANPTDVPGSANQEKAFIYFKGRLDLTNDQSAGIVGNLMAESGPNLNPWAFNSEGGGTGAHGLAQWRGGKPGGRWYAMQQLAAASGVNIIAAGPGGEPAYYPFNFQLSFLCEEMEGNALSNESNALKRLKQARRWDEAAYIIRKFYERPDQAALGDSPYDAQRASFAKAVMDKYA